MKFRRMFKRNVTYDEKYFSLAKLSCSRAISYTLCLSLYYFSCSFNSYDVCVCAYAFMPAFALTKVIHNSTRTTQQMCIYSLTKQ